MRFYCLQKRQFVQDRIWEACFYNKRTVLCGHLSFLSPLQSSEDSGPIRVCMVCLDFCYQQLRLSHPVRQWPKRGTSSLVGLASQPPGVQAPWEWHNWSPELAAQGPAPSDPNEMLFYSRVGWVSYLRNTELTQSPGLIWGLTSKAILDLTCLPALSP